MLMADKTFLSTPIERYIDTQFILIKGILFHFNFIVIVYDYV
jgi:hypothetical protein